MTACTGPTQNSTGTVDADDLEQTLSSLGGQTVNDTTIDYTDGTDTISVGGLKLTMPTLTGYAKLDSRDTYTPPGWPTLNKIMLITVDDDNQNQPTLTWSVMSQTELVTDDTNRARLNDQYQTLMERVVNDITIIHDSHTTNTDNTIHCWTTIWAGESRIGGNLNRGTVFIAGDNIASSGLVIVGLAADDPSARTTAGDAVESACGTRPNGLP